MKAKSTMKKTTKAPSKKKSIAKAPKILEPIEMMIQKLDFKPIHFEVGNSGKCFYCAGSLGDCGCVVLELRSELEKLSDDFKKLCVRNRRGFRVDTYSVFNLKMFPKDGANILAYNIWENRLLYKRYSDGGTLWSTGDSIVSEGRWDENVEIIGVELDDCLYNGLCLTGDSYKNADFCGDRDYVAPKEPLPILRRRAYEIVSPKKNSKEKQRAA